MVFGKPNQLTEYIEQLKLQMLSFGDGASVQAALNPPTPPTPGGYLVALVCMQHGG